MKDLPDTFHQENTTHCHCWAVELINPDDNELSGEVLGFTDHDRDLTFEVELSLESKVVTFKAEQGIRGTAISSEQGLTQDDVDGIGILSSDFITAEDIREGRYNRAPVTIWKVDWTSPIARTATEELPAPSGTIATITGIRFTSESGTNPNAAVGDSFRFEFSGFNTDECNFIPLFDGGFYCVIVRAGGYNDTTLGELVDCWNNPIGGNNVRGDITASLSPGFTEDTLLSSIWTKREFEALRPTFRNQTRDVLKGGHTVLFYGIIGNIERGRQGFKAQVESISSFFNLKLGRVYSDRCLWDFQDGHCEPKMQDDQGNPIKDANGKEMPINRIDTRLNSALSNCTVVQSWRGFAMIESSYFGSANQREIIDEVTNGFVVRTGVGSRGEDRHYRILGGITQQELNANSPAIDRFGVITQGANLEWTPNRILFVLAYSVELPDPQDAIDAGNLLLNRVNLEVGCDKSIQNCSRFRIAEGFPRAGQNNVVNFGGFPKIPGVDKAVQVASKNGQNDGRSLFSRPRAP